MNKDRTNRKKEHLDLFIERSQHEAIDPFANIKLIHNALPDLNFHEIDTQTSFLGKRIDYPIMINAITGGIDEAYFINKSLATLAKKFNIPMAVGSQSIMLNGEGDKRKSFRIVREVHNQGPILANLSATATVDEAKKAIDYLEADGIQLHLNVAQEIVMPEGERKFKGIIKNIKKVVSGLSKPVIIKEVGFGISESVAKTLVDIGVQYIDVGGKGGTNFIAIEDSRNELYNYKELYDWGITTPDSVRMCRKVSKAMSIIASGGITRSDHIVKSICLGANLAGISGYLLKPLMEEGLEKTEKRLEDLLHKLKVIMLLVGSGCIQELTTDKIQTMV